MFVPALWPNRIPTPNNVDGPTLLLKAAFGSTSMTAEAGCLDLCDLVRAGIHDPDVLADLGFFPVGGERAASGGVDTRPHDGAGLQRVGVRLEVDLDVLEVVAEHLVDAYEVQPVHEASVGVEDWLAAEVAPAFELVGILRRDGHHRLHRIGVPGVHELRHLGLVVLEPADALMELAHADVGRVGDLSGAVHHRLHGNGGRGVRLDGDSVFAAERLLDDPAHQGGDLVAVRADRGGRPPHRLALLCVGRVDRRKSEDGDKRHNQY